MSTYYASKNYVVKLTLALYEELRHNCSNVKVSVLCPGPVETNFNNTAGVNFSLRGLTSEYVGKYAVDKMFKNKLIIVPGKMINALIVASRFVPTRLLLKVIYNTQKKKE